MSMVENPHDDSRVDWRTEEDRWTKERARYLEQAADLDRTDAEIVALAELGYSSSGIGKVVGLGASTVRAHFDDVEEAVGPTALMSRTPDELAIQSPPGREGL